MRKRRSLVGWILLLGLGLGSAAARVNAEIILPRHQWPLDARHYVGEWTGEGTMPLPLLTDSGEWQRIPFQVNGRVDFHLRTIESETLQTTLELRHQQPELEFVVAGKKQPAPVKLIPLRVRLSDRGQVHSVLPMDPQTTAEIPPTLFDLPLDYFSFFYPLLFAFLPDQPIEEGTAWEEKETLPLADEAIGSLTVTHHFVAWETRRGRRCARLESHWSTPSLRQRFEMGGQSFFLRNRWSGQFRIWFDPEKGEVWEAEAPVDADVALQFLLPDGTLFDGEAHFTLRYQLRRIEPDSEAENSLPPDSEEVKPDAAGLPAPQ